MLVMTAKVDKKKLALVLAGAAVLVALLVMLFSDSDSTVTTAAPDASTNEGRIRFLTDLGWEVAASPVESGQVKIPQSSGEVFLRYNALQQSQGYDLSQYAGKSVMRYVYKLKNYPGATEPVYATLLVYKGQIVGGDVTDTAAKGVVRSLRMPQSATGSSQLS